MTTVETTVAIAAKRMKTPNDSPLKIWFLAPLSLWLTVLFLLPLLFLLWVGFWRVENFQAIPDFSIGNYREIFASFFSKSRYGLALVQSLWVAITTAFFATILSYMVALSIAFAVPARWQRLALLLPLPPSGRATCYGFTPGRRSCRATASSTPC